MARLVTSGFEQQSLVYPAEGQGLTPVGAPAIETSVVRSGGASLRIAANGQNAVRFSNSSILAEGWSGSGYVAGRAYYLRAYFRTATTTPAASPPILRFEAGTTLQAQVVLDTSRQLLLRNAANATLQTSSPLAIDTWYRVELMFKQDAGTRTNANGTLELRVDGVSVGGTQNSVDAGVANVTRFVVGQNSTSPNATFYFDDVALNDDQTGGTQTSWPGEGHVVLLKPVSDSASGDWKKGAGTNTANLWSSVDNIPPTGKALASAGDEDQIRNATGTAGAPSANYIATCEAYGTGKRVAVVQALATMGNSTTTPHNGKLLVDSNPSDTFVLAPSPSAAAATFPTGWFTVRGNTLYNPSVTLGSGPNVRFERYDTGDELTVCSLGVYVEYRDNITLTPATSTSAAQALDVDKKASTAAATETDSAQAANVDKSVTRTHATETDTAQALVVTKPIHKTLTAATETDSAQALDADKRRIAVTAAESDSAQALNVDKRVSLTAAAESDAAQALAFQQASTHSITPATEADSAQALDADKKVTLGTAAETDTAQALSVPGRQTLTPASETDTAQALDVDKRVAISPASESDAAQGLDTDKRVSVAPAAETDTAQALTVTRPIYVSITPATETDEAQPLTTPSGATPPGGGFLPRQAPHRIPKIKRPIYVTLGVATESDTAQALEVEKVRSLASLEEELVIALVL